MSEITIARRYAQALYEEAEQHQCTERVDEDVAAIATGLDDSRDLVRFFESPVISREKKASIVQSLFAERLQSVTLHFLQLLVEKRRENIFPVIVSAYRSLRDDQQGIAEAFVRTAQAMSEAEEQSIADALETLTGRRIRLQIEVDPELIGGIVIRVGDTVYDGSVVQQLRSLRRRMEQGSFLNN